MVSHTSNSVLDLELSADMEPAKQVLVSVVLASRRVPLSPRGMWQATRELACVEAGVTLTSHDAVLLEHSPAAMEDVEWERKTERVVTDDWSGDVGIGESGLHVKKGSEQKVAEGEAGKDQREYVTVVAAGQVVTWTRYRRVGGRPYIEGTDKLWVRAEESGPAAPRFEAVAVVNKWHLLGRNGEPLPSLEKLAIVAKLLGAGLFDLGPLQPVRKTV